MQFKENGLSIPIKPQKNNQRNLTSKITIVSSAISTLGLAYLTFQHYRKKGYWPNIIPIAPTGTSLKNMATMSVVGALVAAIAYFSRKSGFKFFVNNKNSSNENRYFLSEHLKIMRTFEIAKNLFCINEPDFETEFNKVIEHLRLHRIDSYEPLIEELIIFIEDAALYKFSLGIGTPFIAGIIKAIFFELLVFNKHKALEIAKACVKEPNTETYPSCQDIITATLNDKDLAVEFAIACADHADESEWCQKIAKNALGEFLKMDTEKKTRLAIEYVVKCAERDQDICQSVVIKGFHAILPHNKDGAAEIAMACANNLFPKKHVLRKENKNVIFYVCEQVRNLKGIDKKANESFLKVAKTAAKSLLSVKIETLIYSIEGNVRPKYHKDDAFRILAIKFQDLIRSYIKDRSDITVGLAYLMIKTCLDSKNKELQEFAEQTSQDLKNNGMVDLQNKIIEELKENKKLPYEKYTKYLF